MVKKERNEVMVGTFVVLGFILLTLVVFFISGVYLFRPGYSVTVVYDYVSILDRGAPIRMAGVRVGEVNKVELVYDPEIKKTRVHVKLFIEKGVEIRENYLFKIQGTHILSEPHIEISPQEGDAPLVRHKAVVMGVTRVPVESLLEQANQISGKLNDILANFRSAIADDSTGTSLKQITQNLAVLTNSLNQVLNGSEADLKSTITNLSQSTESLNQILNRIENGEGTVGSLLTKDELYQEMRSFVAEIKTHPWRLMKKDNGGKKFLFF